MRPSLALQVFAPGEPPARAVIFWNQNLSTSGQCAESRFYAIAKPPPASIFQRWAKKGSKSAWGASSRAGILGPRNLGGSGNMLSSATRKPSAASRRLGGFPPGEHRMCRASLPQSRHAAGRPLASALILFSIAFQGLAASRLLCPPRSIEALQQLRLACPPRLWPFLDYPMYSEPHRPGEVLAWIDAHIVSGRGARVCQGQYRVQLTTETEDWGNAYIREEGRLREHLARAVATIPGAAELLLERRLAVLTDRGLVGVFGPARGCSCR